MSKQIRATCGRERTQMSKQIRATCGRRDYLDHTKPK